MQKSGHEIVVLSWSPGQFVDTKVVYRDGGDKQAPRWLRLIRHALFLFKEWRLIRTGNFDLVHLHFLRFDAISLMATIHEISIISLWGSDIMLSAKAEESLRKKIVRLTLERATLVTAVHYCLEDRLRQITSKAKRVELIPFGADLDRFGKLRRRVNSTKSETTNFLYAKPLAPLYGPDIAIKAFAKLTSDFPNARLVLIGGGEKSYVDELQELVNIYSLSKKIEFAGKVRKDVFDAIFEVSDVLLQPSRWDAFGVVILEALASGIPVITTRVGGLKDIVIDGVTGFTVPSEDVDALTEAMKDMADDDEMRRQMGRNAHELVNNLYGFSMHAKLMEEIYNELTEKR